MTRRQTGLIHGILAATPCALALAAVASPGAASHAQLRSGASSVQAQIDAAQPGERIELSPGSDEVLRAPLNIRNRQDLVLVFNRPLRYDLGQAGKQWPVVDLTGSRHVRIENLMLQPADSRTPGVFCHVLMARVPSADGNEPSANDNHVELKVRDYQGNKGSALAFNVIALGSEGSSITGSIGNAIGGNVYVGSGNDKLNVRSPHGPVFSGWTSTIGFTISGEFAAGGAYPNIVLDGTASSVRIVNASFSRKINAGHQGSFAPCAIEIGRDGASAAARNNNIRDCYFEYSDHDFAADVALRGNVQATLLEGSWIRHGVAKPLAPGRSRIITPEGQPAPAEAEIRSWDSFRALPTSAGRTRGGP